MEVKPVKTKNVWIENRWRPALGWAYIAICLFDFIIGPLVNFSFFQVVGGDFQSWKALTMTDGGMFHLAMGAVLGVTSWTRGQEKINRIKYASEYMPPDDLEPTGPNPAEYRDRMNRENTIRENR